MSNNSRILNNFKNRPKVTNMTTFEGPSLSIIT